MLLHLSIRLGVRLQETFNCLQKYLLIVENGIKYVVPFWAIDLKKIDFSISEIYLFIMLISHFDLLTT